MTFFCFSEKQINELIPDQVLFHLFQKGEKILLEKNLKICMNCCVFNLVGLIIKEKHIFLIWLIMNYLLFYLHKIFYESIEGWYKFTSDVPITCTSITTVGPEFLWAPTTCYYSTSSTKNIL